MIGYRYRRYCSDWQILCSGLAFVAVMAAGIYLQPGFRPLTTQVSGDKALVAFLTPLLKGAHGHVAAALITPGGVRYGIWGNDYARQFEIGSLSKTLTASLLIDAIRRGEVTATTQVGDLVPELVGPARNISLEELVSHRSGLPPFASSLTQKIAMLTAIVRRENPWSYERQELAEMINRARIPKVKIFDYSNSGFALLGLALERASHRTFAALLEQRVFAPAGMTRSLVAQETTPPDAAFMPGWSASGLREAPWILNAFSPAAGVRSTIVDMTKYTQALMAGKLAGSQGMAPRFATDDPDSRVGYSWFTTAIKGRDIIWHDGQSAGYAAVMAFDPERKTAVVILSDTAWPVIVPAIKLLLSTLSDVKEER